MSQVKDMPEEDNVQEDFSIGFNIFYLTISTLTLAECAFTFFINKSNRALREKANTSFGNNLAASIGFLSSVSFVCNVYFIEKPQVAPSLWPCFLLSVLVKYLHAVSCLTLACMSLDRYVAICYPLHYYSLLTRIRCRLLCLTCWVTPFVLLLMPCASELPTLCSNNGVSITFLFAYAVIYTLGALATFTFYILVALEFRRERGCHAPDKDQIERILRTRTANSAMRVFALYVLFSLPHTIFPLVKMMLPKSTSLPTSLIHAFYVINRIHLLLFLPVYAWTNAIVQKTLKAWIKALGVRLSHCPRIPQALRARTKTLGDCTFSSPCLKPQERLEEEDASFHERMRDAS